MNSARAARRQTVGQYTDTAGRNDNTGHADLAWALLHALHHEPLEGQTTANTGRMEIY
ncbi:hypothetical protein [Pseudomonas sp. Sample_21]|uniref:hypothetical protein n=1 Tax=Pseudomonas sp. Sample_21 TaxID=2448265 RepID=UPI0015B16987|nr:hypothetical protein [Pseudomonas sp. Sample_21]